MKSGIAPLFLAVLPSLLAPVQGARADHHESHAATVAAAVLPRTPSVPGASVYIISPRDGDTLSSPFTVRFGLKGMGIAPAGVTAAETGHHHLIVDAPTPSLDTVLPNDAKHQHFGKGQTEVTLELPPGEHTLQLVLADHIHLPHQPPLVSERIKITVK
jgi:hypothetical protein